MARRESSLVIAAWFLAIGLSNSFTAVNRHHQIRPPSRLAVSAEDDAAALMEKVKKMREEIASLEGMSVDTVEQEVSNKKAAEKDRLENMEAERERVSAASSSSVTTRKRAKNGKFLSVPMVADDQVEQAAGAVEAAFKDGISRQVVRFSLLPESKTLSEDIQWPGGAQQMYREAAGPLTRSLMGTIRAVTGNATAADVRYHYRPNVTTKDVLDFDGSALVTASAATGPQDNIEALVFPNTDTKYTNDIKDLDEKLGGRLLLLVNPFWRDISSWGINILAPKGKQLAQEIIFDRPFEETYVLLKKSVRGEDCVALKVYPYDWQLYAFREDDSWPYAENILWLGSTPTEPTTVEFSALLEEREEFKYNKNMRNLQRMQNRD